MTTTADRIRKAAKFCGWAHWESFEGEERADIFHRNYAPASNGIYAECRTAVRVVYINGRLARAHRWDRDTHDVRVIGRLTKKKADRVIEWLCA